MCRLMVCNITGGYALHQQNTNQSPTSNGSSERGSEEDVDLGFMQLGQSLWYRNLLDFPPLICLYTCTGASLWNKHDPYPLFIVFVCSCHLLVSAQLNSGFFVSMRDGASNFAF